ncbi:hypothetical protein [Coraliomargarita akajimensis]|uniref:Lipoprotein n=1 Tax=Coraliomargarita akajimensis (strain DSM 45221 / IAM 15411 / JCM 23193 / KCTC 12865 / 04OKA010-24) TaxID=583355 RepID=D5EP39_CORAD|nr:hypothetical protein [Coraliomargarita akajimensis]ADE55549.1 hypothetical protein Caka_2533 [Coraliomargarita akajimensis DSM 45221]
MRKSKCFIPLAIILGASLLLAGCGTRSYSDNGVQVQQKRSVTDYIPFF